MNDKNKIQKSRHKNVTKTSIKRNIAKMKRNLKIIDRYICINTNEPKDLDISMLSQQYYFASSTRILSKTKVFNLRLGEENKTKEYSNFKRETQITCKRKPLKNLVK